MAKREATNPAPAASEPQKSPESAAVQKSEKRLTAADEALSKKTGADEGQAAANLALEKRYRAKSSAAVPGTGFGAPGNPAVGGNQIAATAKPVAPAPPVASEVVVEAETAKQQRAVETDQAKAVPAPTRADALTVRSIQKQERAAKVAEEKERSANAASGAPLKRDRAAEIESAAANRAPARLGYGVSGGVAGGAMARQLMAAGEFVVTTPNPKILWRFGSSGLIERSRDAGKTWERQKSPVQEAFLSGSAPSDKICWAGGKNGVLLRTTDGGDHWEAVPSPTQTDVVHVKALDQANVTVVDADGRTFETRNAGSLWRVP
jgi:hypothetical protein